MTGRWEDPTNRGSAGRSRPALMHVGGIARAAGRPVVELRCEFVKWTGYRCVGRSTRRSRSRIATLLAALGAAVAVAYLAAGMHAAVGTYVHFATHEPARVEVRAEFEPEDHSPSAVAFGAGGGAVSSTAFIR